MIFTEEAPVDSFVEDSKLSQTVQAQFNGTFIGHLLTSSSDLWLLSASLRILLQRNPFIIQHTLIALPSLPFTHASSNSSINLHPILTLIFDI